MLVYVYVCVYIVTVRIVDTCKSKATRNELLCKVADGGIWKKEQNLNGALPSKQKSGGRQSKDSRVGTWLTSDVVRVVKKIRSPLTPSAMFFWFRFPPSFLIFLSILYNQKDRKLAGNLILIPQKICQESLPVVDEIFLLPNTGRSQSR